MSKILSYLGSKLRTPAITAARKLLEQNLALQDWTHVLFLRQDADDEWVFDIPFAGISDEPFVDGIPEIIEDYLLKSKLLSTAQKYGVTVLFSGAKRKPKEFGHGTYFKLTKLHTENGGCWYKDNISGFEGWLCPNLYQYFASSPQQIHVCIRG